MIVETFNQLDYNSVKDRIVTRVVNAKAESHLLMDRPCSYVKDLAVLYDIEMFHTNGTRATMQVNNTLFSQWDVTMEDLHKNALDVTAQRNPYVLSNMDDELWGSPVNFLDGADYVNAGMLLVASNEQKHYGANIIADKNMLEKISQVINDDMYILPSSVHELLILPKENAKDLGMTPKALGEMVREVNRTQVEPKERLANHVYEYNRDTKELAIVNSSREKAMER